jgi:hypothetical protein
VVVKDVQTDMARFALVRASRLPDGGFQLEYTFLPKRPKGQSERDCSPTTGKWHAMKAFREKYVSPIFALILLSWTNQQDPAICAIWRAWPGVG